VYPTPILVAGEPTCQGQTGTFVITSNPDAGTHEYQLVGPYAESGMGTAPDPGSWDTWTVDDFMANLSGLTPGFYELHKRGVNGNDPLCYTSVEVEIESCCLEEDTIVITNVAGAVSHE
jgi:hypothetical protein